MLLIESGFQNAQVQTRKYAAQHNARILVTYMMMAYGSMCVFILDNNSPSADDEQTWIVGYHGRWTIIALHTCLALVALLAFMWCCIGEKVAFLNSHSSSVMDKVSGGQGGSWQKRWEHMQKSQASSIDLSGLCLRPTDTAKIAKLIKDTTNLTSVKLIGSYIQPPQAHELISVMNSKESLSTLCGFTRNLTELDLSSSNLTAGCAFLVSNELRLHGTMSKLTMHKCKLPIQQLKTEPELDFCDKELHFVDIIVIAELIKDNMGLSSLDLSGSSEMLGPKKRVRGSVLLSENGQQNGESREKGGNCNNRDDHYFFKGEIVTHQGQEVTVVGFWEESLDVCFTGGITALFNAIKGNRRPIALNLENCDLNLDGNLMRVLLDGNPAWSSLNISRNYMSFTVADCKWHGPSGWAALIAALPKCLTLSQLDMRDMRCLMEENDKTWSDSQIRQICNANSIRLKLSFEEQ